MLLNPHGDMGFIIEPIRSKGFIVIKPSLYRGLVTAIIVLPLALVVVPLLLIYSTVECLN